MMDYTSLSKNPDVLNVTVISLLLGTGLLAGSRKYALSVICGCALIMVSLNTSKRENLLLTTGNKHQIYPQGASNTAPPAESDPAEPNPDAIDDVAVEDTKLKTAVITEHVREYDDAVHEDLIRTDDPGLALDSHVVTAFDSNALHLSGQSKYLFDQKFTVLPSQIHKPVISTTFSEQKKEDQQPTAKGLQELLARQSFYNSIASGGDIEPRINPGLATMHYLATNQK